MKSKTLTVVNVALFCITFLYKAQGQVAITNIEDFAKIKNGTTYVAMKDPNAVKAKPFIDAIKSCWTLSKIEFIKFSEMENHFEPNSSFLTYGDIEKNYYRESWSNSGYSRGVNHQSTHVYFEFWTIVDKFFKGDKKRVRLGPGDKIQLARIELFTDFSTTQVPDKLLKVDFDGMGHINNWSPGILKNYLLLMTDLLNKGKERKLYSETYNMKEIKELSNQTLYVPHYVLNKFNNFTGDESNEFDEKDIFEDYKAKYKLLSTSELNDKILNESSPFYYLIYVKSCTDKFISVIKSQTGEMIYSTYAGISYNFKSGDLKDLQKKINSK